MTDPREQEISNVGPGYSYVPPSAPPPPPGMANPGMPQQMPSHRASGSPRRSRSAIVFAILTVVGLLWGAAMTYLYLNERGNDSTDAAHTTTVTVTPETGAEVGPKAADIANERRLAEESLRTFYDRMSNAGPPPDDMVCQGFLGIWHGILDGQNIRITSVSGITVSAGSAYVDYEAIVYKAGVVDGRYNYTTLMKNEDGQWKWCGTATR